MVYELKDLTRLTEELKGCLFRMNQNPTREMALRIEQAENTIESLEADIEQIKIESEKG